MPQKAVMKELPRRENQDLARQLNGTGHKTALVYVTEGTVGSGDGNWTEPHMCCHSQVWCSKGTNYGVVAALGLKRSIFFTSRE